jgi:hypothetical protein
MASSGKRKTTMAKLSRESKLREKRAIKEARKAQRKQEPSDGSDSIGYNDDDEYFGRLADDPTASTGS